MREAARRRNARLLLGDPKLAELVRRYEASHPAMVERLNQDAAIDASLETFRRREAPDLTDDQLKADLAKRAKKAFASGPIGVRVPSSALPALLRDGRIKTQFETGTTLAILNPEFRAQKEEQLFGLPQDLDPAKRPVYGYVMTTGLGTVMKPGDEPPEFVDTFGDVRVVLRDDVRQRTTAMVGDSLDQLSSGRPAPVDDPDWRAFTPVGEHPLGWQPKLMKLNRNYGSKTFNRDTYIEAQIHGGVTLDDIAYIALPTEPDAPLRRLLEQSGVSWRVMH